MTARTESDTDAVPEWNGQEAQVVRRVPGGPVLVRGPVRLIADDGREVVCDRFVVAVCRCRLSSIHPLCDTSHRELRRPRTPPDACR
ncbi:Iron-binding zinc finger protein, CDGSH type [Rhodococcus sp. RD6.2]|uniref:CDGSH iron-sulfur domain-containing protein n=1 Tax=Rhodococcus sp. RD6.2 TaxID=260936 RepID=UPI00063B5E27|nr:Iron-binding zinc finger protein, CDGSH type [Rhodococcus sp. RD6.2]